MKYFARQIMQANTTICLEHLKIAVFAQGKPGMELLLPSTRTSVQGMTKPGHRWKIWQQVSKIDASTHHHDSTISSKLLEPIFIKMSYIHD